MLKNKFIQNKTINWLYLILGLSLLIRIVFFLYAAPWESSFQQQILVSDSLGYHKLANLFIREFSFQHFDSLRTPGYPLFLSLFYAAFSNGVVIALFAQLFVNLVSIYLVYKISLLFSSDNKVALLSCFLFSIDIYQLIYSQKILTETLFVCLFLSSVYYLLLFRKNQRFSTLLFCAFVLGLTTLVRPIAQLLPLVYMLIIIFLQVNWKKKFLYLGSFAGVFFLVISPWLFHNYQKSGHLGLSSISGSNLLFFNVAYTEAYRTHQPVEVIRDSLKNIAQKKGIDTTILHSFKNSEVFMKISKNYIREHFLIYSKRSALGVMNLFTGIASSHIDFFFKVKYHKVKIQKFGGSGIFYSIKQYFVSKSTLELLITMPIILYLFFSYVYCLLGFYNFRKNKILLLFFFLIIAYFAFLTGTVGIARYRLPIMPFINIVSAYGFVFFLSRYRKWRHF